VDVESDVETLNLLTVLILIMTLQEVEHILSTIILSLIFKLLLNCKQLIFFPYHVVSLVSIGRLGVLIFVPYKVFVIQLRVPPVLVKFALVFHLLRHRQLRGIRITAVKLLPPLGVLYLRLIHVSLAVPIGPSVALRGSLTHRYLQLLGDLHELLFIHLEPNSIKRHHELLKLMRTVASRAFLEDLLLFRLWEGHLEVFTELHELSQINLAHPLLELIELPVLGDVLSRVEVEDFLQAPFP